MQTLKFKTNINCGSCIRAVTPALDQAAGAGNWQVDTAAPNKLLTVTSDHLTAGQIAQAVRSAGFDIQPA